MDKHMTEEIINLIVGERLAEEREKEYLIGTICSPLERNIPGEQVKDTKETHLNFHSNSIAKDIGCRLLAQLKRFRSVMKMDEVTADEVLALGHPWQLSEASLVISCLKKADVASVDFDLNPRGAVNSLMSIKGKDTGIGISDLQDFYVGVFTWEKENIEDLTSTVTNLHQYVTRNMSGSMQ